MDSSEDVTSQDKTNIRQTHEKILEKPSKFPREVNHEGSKCGGEGMKQRPPHRLDPLVELAVIEALQEIHNHWTTVRPSETTNGEPMRTDRSGPATASSPIVARSWE